MSKWIGWIVIAIGALILAAVIVSAGAGIVDAQASRNAAETYGPRGEFVEVNGAQMHVICQGDGERTLVLQAGIGGEALDRLPLMETMDDEFRVCAFDRLGQDWSDPAPMPRTFADAADELHIAVMRPRHRATRLWSAIRWAALLCRSMQAATMLPGWCLVDGLSLGATPEVTERLGTYQHLDWAGRLGLLRPLGLLMANAAYTDELRAEMKTLRSRSSTLLEFSVEGAVAARSAAEELAVAEQNIDVPMLIIAAGNSELPEGDIFLESLRESCRAPRRFDIPSGG